MCFRQHPRVRCDNHVWIKCYKLYRTIPIERFIFNYTFSTVNTDFFSKKKQKMAKNWAFLLFFLRFLVRGDKKTRHNLSMQEAKTT